MKRYFGRKGKWLFTIAMFLARASIFGQNVGIGTNTPKDKLTVNGTIRAERNSTSLYPQLLLNETEFDYARLMFSNSSDQFSSWTLAGRSDNDTTAARFHLFHDYSGNVFSATARGRIGVNVSNPVATLMANSKIGTDPLRIQNNGNTKFRIFSNNAISIGSNWANPIPGVIRMSTPHLMIGFADNYSPSEMLEVNGGIKVNRFYLPAGAQKNHVLMSDGVGEGFWTALPEDKVEDSDSDPTNELQTLSKDGQIVTLSNGGGFFYDDDIDSDSDPFNELQSLSINGNQLSISGGNTVTIANAGSGGEFISDGTGDNIVHTNFLPTIEGISMVTNGEASFFFQNSYFGKAMQFSNNNFNVSIAGAEPLNLGSGGGSHNVAIGNFAQNLTSVGDSNIVIANNSGLNLSGRENVILGNKSGTGDRTRNVTIGYLTGASLAGNENVCIGHIAGNGAGQENVYIGDQAGPNGMGNWNRGGGIGYLANVTQSNQYVFGNSFTQQIGGYEPWSNLSDGRFKRNIKEEVPGLSFITKLRPVTYNIDAVAVEKFTRSKESYDRLDPDYLADLARRADEPAETGFIAQEVEVAAKELGYHFDGVLAPANDHDPYAIAYSQFVVPIIKAVQELDEKNKKFEKENQRLNLLIDEITNQMSAINQELEIMRNQIESNEH